MSLDPQIDNLQIDRGRLDRVVEAYGGVALWRSLKRIVVRVEALGGPLPVIKGLGRTFATPGIVTIEPAAWRVTFHDYPQAGERVIFDAGTIRRYDAAGAETFARVAYRESFRGLRKYRRWSHTDAAYFFGYALATYFSIPFVLPEYATRVEAWGEGVCVTARFPEGLDTHSARQRFWFDGEGLLVRHDYRADIVGVWAAGAHFTSGYERVGGLPVASRRDVYARIFRHVTPLPVLSARLHAVEVATMT